MKEVKFGLIVFSLYVALFIFLLGQCVQAVPVGPDTVTINSNTTKTSPNSYMLNISGGRILNFNLSSRVQNPRWKAFLGQVTGSFTLDDSAGSTVYDWSLSSITGEIYTTRNSSTITWTNLTCATAANLNTENTRLGHASASDNLTATFNVTAGATHAGFFVASVNISQNTCPTLNTYVGNHTQDTDFEEVALWEALGGNVVYSTILEEDAVGYDNRTYDFQMIVPERGDAGNTAVTAYYLYVELS